MAWALFAILVVAHVYAISKTISKIKNDDDIPPSAAAVVCP